MHNRKSMLLGSSWALVRFALVFAKSIVLVPLILSFWNTQLYTFWVLLLAFNALWFSVYDGYIRYVTNAYNLYFYKSPQQAASTLGSGIRFAAVCSVLLLSALGVAVYGWPALTGAVFRTSVGEVLQYRLAAALLVFIAGNTLLNLLRFFYALNDPHGKLWRNLRFEVLYSTVEIAVLVLSVFCLRDFYLVVLANAIVYIAAAVFFIISLRKKYPHLPAVISSGNMREGARLFRRSLPFIGNNFAEKLTTDSYTLLLSFFAWPALVIRQFASVRTMTNAGISGMNIFQAVQVPRLQELEAKKNTADLQKLCSRLWLLAALLCGILLIPAYPFLERAYLAWTKEKIAFDPVVFGLLFICLLFVLYGNVLLYYLKSVNETRAVLKVTIVKGALLLALLLVLPHTAVTAVTCLLIVEVAANVLLYPAMVARKWQREASTASSAFFMLHLLPFLLIAAMVAYYTVWGFGYAAAFAGCIALLMMLFFLCRKTNRFLKRD